MSNVSALDLARSRRYTCISLALLLLTYSVLGWFVGLHQFNWVHPILHPIPQVEWWISVVGTIIVSGFVTAPLARVRQWILEILKVDDWMFMASLGGALLLIFFLIHMDVVIKLIVLTAALLLARFDLVNSRWSGWSAFVLLSLVGVLGLGLGGWGHWATLHYHVSPWADIEKNQFELMLEKPTRSAPNASELSESTFVESQSSESKPAESKPAESQSVESSKPKPAEPKPTEPKPAESREPKPTESKPTTSKSVESREAKPTESKPAESKPDKPKSVESKSND
jgi:hypothetical protein